MAKILPAAWPNLDPSGNVDPGLSVYDAHVQAVVEGQHHFQCRYGKRHVAEQFFQIGAPPLAAECRVTAAFKTLVLEYIIVPRLAMGLGVRLMGRVDGLWGSQVYCDCIEDVSASNSGMLGAGPQWFAFNHVFAGSRSMTDTTLQISLLPGAGAGLYCDLMALFIYDADLAAVP